MTPALQDLRLIARLILYWLVAGIVPPSRWQTAMELYSKAWSSKKLNRTYADALESIEHFEQALGRSDNAPPERKAADVLFGRQENTLCMLRECWPWGWNPTIRVSGAERIFDALETGKGVVLWVALQNNRLAWKKALHGLGIRVAHLSRPEHGLSKTAFGIRYLNPFGTRVESRYVERVVIEPGHEAMAILALHRKLSRNEVVSIQDSGSSGQTIEVPFLTGYRSFFIGAPSLALASGATLLPLFPLRQNTGAFGVEIGPAIHAPEGASRELAIATMTREYARQLGEQVRAQPQHWGWQRYSKEPRAAG